MSAKKVTKFGVQSSKSRVITVFRNGDKFHKGERITLGKKFKNMDHLLTHASNVVKLSSGAVRKIVTPKGVTVSKLSSFKDGSRYIAIGGEGSINKPNFPLALKKKKVKEVAEEPELDKVPVQPIEKKKVVKKKFKGEKFGTQAKKAVSILVFRNGDKHHAGERITINWKTMLNMDQLKDKINDTVGLGTPCRRVYTVPGHKVVKNLDSFKDGKKYIAVGGELKINEAVYPSALKKKKKTPKTPASPSDDYYGSGNSTPSMEKETVIEKKFEGEKFGTQAEKARVIKVFRNNDKHHTGVNITLNMKTIKNFDQLKERINRKVGLGTSCRCVYKYPGLKKVTKLSSFVDKGNYIAVGGELHVNKERIPLCLKKKKKAPKQQQEQYEPVVHKPKKKVVSKKFKGEKFGTQAQKAVAIFVFRNGDKHDQGTKITINPNRMKTLEQLKEKINDKVAVGTPCRKIYSVPGHKVVKALEKFKDQHRYIACGGELKINMENYPLALKS